MKTTDIKKILAKDPNAIFVMKSRWGRSTNYCVITEVIETEVPVYSNYSYNKVIGTRTDAKFNVLYANYSSGRLISDGASEDKAPVYWLATSRLEARQIQSHLEYWSGGTIQEWVAQQDAEAKANWQSRIDLHSDKQRQVNAVIRHISSPTVTDAEWNKLNDDLMGLRIETLQLITQRIASLV